MNKIEEIVNFIRSNTNIPNYGVFIICGLLVDNKKYEEIIQIYNFLSLNLKNYQEMDLIEFDKFLVDNKMYENTYYSISKSNLLNTKIGKKINEEEHFKKHEEHDNKTQDNEDLEEIKENQQLSNEEQVKPTKKIYASQEELNIKFRVRNIINFEENDLIGWSGVTSRDQEHNNTYYFYQRDHLTGSFQKAIIFSY